MAEQVTFRIGDRVVGAGAPTFVIAEIGSNHDGDLGRARALIAEAVAAGADAVKLQSFTADGLVNRHLGCARGGAVEHPAHAILDRLTVPAGWHGQLKEYTESLGAVFLSAPFDKRRLELLADIGVDAFKVASSEVTNLPFLRQVASLGRPVLLSTGMAELEEAARAAAVLREAGSGEFALLHCVSMYPTPMAEANLRAITALQPLAPVVGFSDHTIGLTAPLGAVALGASIIEKHVTDDRGRSGPDHGYAMEFAELREMVRRIRELELALGHGEKRPGDAERGERAFSFRGLYTAAPLAAGTVLTEAHLKCVRPAGPLGPGDLPNVVGRTLRGDLPAHAALNWDDLA